MPLLERYRSRSAHSRAMTETFMTDETSTQASNGKTSLADAFRTHFSGDAPLTEKAKSFAKAKPWASAALVGVAAIAVLNTLRGVRN